MLPPPEVIVTLSDCILLLTLIATVPTPPSQLAVPQATVAPPPGLVIVESSIKKSVAS